MTGNPVSVHDPVAVIPGNNGNSGIFVSRGGALVTMRGAETGQLTWMARDGALRSVTPDVRSFVFPRLSPDGRRIAVIVKDAGTEKTDAWVYDLGTATLSRVTSLESVSNLEWTRDGKNLVVTSAATQDRSAFWLQPVGGGVAPTKLGEMAELSITAALAPDGSALLATVLHENTWSVMRVPLAPKGAPSVYVDAKGTDLGAALLAGREVGGADVR